MNLSKEKHLLIMTVLAIVLIGTMPAALLSLIIPEKWIINIFAYDVPLNLFLIPICLTLAIIFRKRITKSLEKFVFE